MRKWLWNWTCLSIISVNNFHIIFPFLSRTLEGYAIIIVVENILIILNSIFVFFFVRSNLEEHYYYLFVLNNTLRKFSSTSTTTIITRTSFILLFRNGKKKNLGHFKNRLWMFCIIHATYVEWVDLNEESSIRRKVVFLLTQKL